MDETIASLPPHLAQHGRRKLRITDGTLDDAGLERQCPLDDGHLARAPVKDSGQPPRKRQRTQQTRQTRHTKHTKHCLHALSALEALPPELLAMILATLDVPTLVAVRRVSRRAMAATDALRPYRMMRTHCPNVLRAAVCLEARAHSIAALFAALQTADCAACGGHGSFNTDPFSGPYSGPRYPGPQRLANFFCLITATRVCYCCFLRKADCLPMSLPQAARALRMPKAKALAFSETALPRVHCLAGRYTPIAKKVSKRAVLFDRAAVRRACQAAGLPQDSCKPQLGPGTREVSRHMAIISAPYFGPSPQSVDWGFHCNLCVESTRPETYYRLPYTKDGVLEHLQQFHSLPLSNSDNQ